MALAVLQFLDSSSQVLVGGNHFPEARLSRQTRLRKPYSAILMLPKRFQPHFMFWIRPKYYLYNGHRWGRLAADFGNNRHFSLIDDV